MTPHLTTPILTPAALVAKLLALLAEGAAPKVLAAVSAELSHALVLA